MDVKIDPGWKEVLKEEFDKPYFENIVHHLKVEKSQGKIIYAPGSLIFNAFNTTPFEKVKVVILGQDPYHGPGQAHGLCFSVPPEVQPPPSLLNIYKELESDLGVRPCRHGFLEHWAKQGVLLLNSVLTVEMGRAASHRDRGWERFAVAVVRLVNAKPEPVVFMLWGSYAQKKAAFVDQSRHLV